MHPLKSAPGQALERMHFLIFFICVRLSQLKGSVWSGCNYSFFPYASARDNYETAFGADATSYFLHMRPPESAQMQRSERMQPLIFFKCVRSSQLKGNIWSGYNFSISLYASAQDSSKAVFEADTSSLFLHFVRLRQS